MKLFILIILTLFSYKNNLFGPEQETGFININNEDNDIFYWLHYSKNQKDSDPLVLWFNGGPGYSSVYGCLVEVCSVIYKNKKLTENQYGWNKISNLLIIDQPIGTGYSKGVKKDIPNSSYKAGEQIIIFLQKFYNKYPSFKNRKLYVAGESYGGHYVPIFADMILNSKIKYFNLQGILVVNGLYDISTQYKGFVDFGRKYDLFHPFQIYMMEKIISIIKILKKFDLYDLMFYLSNKFLLFPTPYFRKPFNLYDIRQEKEEDDGLLELLGKKHIQKDLNVEGRNWSLTSSFIFSNFKIDFFIDVIPTINNLLKNKIYVYLVNGKTDYVCNYMGNRWVNEKIYEYIRNNNIDNKYFSYSEFENSGHMVPKDQPKESIELLQKLIS